MAHAINCSEKCSNFKDCVDNGNINRWMDNATCDNLTIADEEIGLSKDEVRLIVELYLKPLLVLVDGLLMNPVFLSTAELSLKHLIKKLNTARAVSGILLDMDAIDNREFTLKTYKAAVELLKVRFEQQQYKISSMELASDRKAGLNSFLSELGF